MVSVGNCNGSHVQGWERERTMSATWEAGLRSIGLCVSSLAVGIIFYSFFYLIGQVG